MSGLCAEGADALSNSQYFIGRATNSARRALRTITPQAEPKLARRYEEMVFNGDLATLGSPDILANERRFVLSSVDDDIARWPLEKADEFCAAAKNGNCDLWLTD